MSDEQSTEIATTTSGNTALSTTRFEPQGLKELMKLSNWISESGLCPDGVESPQDVLVIAMKGASAGLNVMQSLNEVHVIKGKPSFSAKLKIALARQHPDCEYFRMVELTDEKCVWETKRRGHDKPTRYPYTLDDAKKAMPEKFEKKKSHWKMSNWQKRPKDMLRARAGSKLAEIVYGEVTVGLKTPDDIAAETVHVGEAVTDEHAKDPNSKYGGSQKEEVVDAEFEEADEQTDDEPDSDDTEEVDLDALRETQNRRIGGLIAHTDDLEKEDSEAIRDAIASACDADSYGEADPREVKLLIDTLGKLDGDADDGPSERAEKLEEWGMGADDDGDTDDDEGLLV